MKEKILLIWKHLKQGTLKKKKCGNRHYGSISTADVTGKP